MRAVEEAPVSEVDELTQRDRKAEHIRLALSEKMQLQAHFFDRFTFRHCALPEIDFDDIDLSLEFVGKPMDAGGLKRTWKRIIRDAGVGHVRFHDLRHVSATYMLQAGVPVKVVSERLGHSRTSTTTDTYAHVMPGMGRAAAEALENHMVNTWSKVKEA